MSDFMEITAPTACTPPRDGSGPCAPHAAGRRAGAIAALLALLALAACDYAAHEVGAVAVAVAAGAERLGDDDPQTVPAYDVSIAIDAIDEAGGNSLEISGVVTDLLVRGERTFEQLPRDSQLSLIARAGPDHFFGGWQGGCSSAGLDATCTVTVNGPVGITARFAPRRELSLMLAGFRGATLESSGAAVTVSASFGGDARYGELSVAAPLSGSVSRWPQGSTLTLTAEIPSSSGTFVSWTGCVPVPDAPSSCVLSLGGDSQARAVFRPMHAVDIEASATNAASGWTLRWVVRRGADGAVVPGAGDELAAAGTRRLQVLSGRRLELAASTSGNALFGQWAGACATPDVTADCGFVVSRPSSAAAHFGRPVTLNIMPDTGVRVELLGVHADATSFTAVSSAPLADGSAVRLAAFSDDPARAFVRWGGACADFGRAPVCELSLAGNALVSVVSAARREVELRIVRPGALRVESVDTASGEVFASVELREADGEGTFAMAVADGDSLRLTPLRNIDPATGPLSLFLAWSSAPAGLCAAGAETCTVVIGQDTTLTASFSVATLLEALPLSSALGGAGGNRLRVGSAADGAGLAVPLGGDPLPLPVIIASTPHAFIVPVNRPLRLEALAGAAFRLGSWESAPDPEAGQNCATAAVCVVEPGEKVSRVTAAFYPVYHIAFAAALAPDDPARMSLGRLRVSAGSGPGAEHALTMAEPSQTMSATLGEELVFEALDALEGHPGVLGHVAPDGSATLFSHWKVVPKSPSINCRPAAPATASVPRQLPSCRVLVTASTGGVVVTAVYRAAATVALERAGAGAGAGALPLEDPGSVAFLVGGDNPARPAFRLIAPAGSAHAVTAQASADPDPVDPDDPVDAYRFLEWSRGAGCAGSSAVRCVAAVPREGTEVYTAAFQALRRFSVAAERAPGVSGGEVRVSVDPPGPAPATVTVVAGPAPTRFEEPYGAIFSMEPGGLGAALAFAGWRGPRAGGYPCGGSAGADPVASLQPACSVAADASMPAAAAYAARFSTAATSFTLAAAGQAAGAVRYITPALAPPFAGLVAHGGSGGSTMATFTAADRVPAGTVFELVAEPAGASLFDGWELPGGGATTSPTVEVAAADAAAATATFSVVRSLLLARLGSPDSVLELQANQPMVAVAPGGNIRFAAGELADTSLAGGEQAEFLLLDGASATVTVRATTGVGFVRWLFGPAAGTCAGLAASCATGEISTDTRVSALFTPLADMRVSATFALAAGDSAAAPGAGAVSLRSGVAALGDLGGVALGESMSYTLPDPDTRADPAFPVTANARTRVSLLASTPSAAAVFNRWALGPCASPPTRSYSPRCEFDASVADRELPAEVDAEFLRPALLTVAIDVTGSVTGSVALVSRATSETLSGARSATLPLPPGAEVTLRALPGARSQFSGWSSDVPACPTAGAPVSCTFTISESTTVTASFVAALALDVAVAGGGSVNVAVERAQSRESSTVTTASAGRFFVSGMDTVVLTATPDAGNALASWTGCAAAGSSSPATVVAENFKSCVVSGLRADSSVTATFGGKLGPSNLLLSVPFCPPGDCGGAAVALRDAASGGLLWETPLGAEDTRSSFGAFISERSTEPSRQPHILMPADDVDIAIGQRLSIVYTVGDTGRVTLNDPPDRSASPAVFTRTITAQSSSDVAPFVVWRRIHADLHRDSLFAPMHLGHLVADIEVTPTVTVVPSKMPVLLRPFTTAEILAAAERPLPLGISSARFRSEILRAHTNTADLALELPGAALRNICAVRGRPARADRSCEFALTRGFTCTNVRCEVEAVPGIDLTLLLHWGAYPLAVSAGPGGSVSLVDVVTGGAVTIQASSSASVMVGANPVLQATTSTGFAFLGWGGDCAGQGPRCALGPLFGASAVTATAARFGMAGIRVVGPGSLVSLSFNYPGGPSMGDTVVLVQAVRAGNPLDWGTALRNLISSGTLLDSLTVKINTQTAPPFGDLLGARLFGAGGASASLDCSSGNQCSIDLSASTLPAENSSLRDIFRAVLEVEFRGRAVLQGIAKLYVDHGYASYRLCRRALGAALPLRADASCAVVAAGVLEVVGSSLPERVGVYGCGPTGGPTGCTLLRGSEAQVGLDIASGIKHIVTRVAPRTTSRFGTIALSDSGTLAVGSFSGGSDVHVYTPAGDGFTAQVLLAGPDGKLDGFGGDRGLALSADGDTLAVAAPFEDSSATGTFVPGGAGYAAAIADNSVSASGAVYVYSRSATGQWNVDAFIKAPNAEAGDFFGRSIALSADGDTLAVAAPREAGSRGGTFVPGGPGYATALADNNAFRSGAVYVYSRSTSGQWNFDAFIKTPYSKTSAGIGSRDVALSADGNTLAFSSVNDGSTFAGVFSPGDPDYATALSNNGSPGSTDPVSGRFIHGVGAAYVYSRSATGQWNVDAFIKPPNANVRAAFGSSIAMSSADGRVLAVGQAENQTATTGVISVDDSALIDAGLTAGSENVFDAGAVYAYSRPMGGQWRLEAFIKAPNAENFDAFGRNIALSAAGNILAASAPRERGALEGVFSPGDPDYEDALNSFAADEEATVRGAVYVYSRPSSTDPWSLGSYIKSPNVNLAEFNLALSAAGVLALGNGSVGGIPISGVLSPGDPGFDATLSGARTNNARSGVVYLY